MTYFSVRFRDRSLILSSLRGKRFQSSYSFFCSRPNFLDELARKRLLRRLILRGSHPDLRWSRNLGIAWEYTKWPWHNGVWGNIVVRRGKELPFSIVNFLSSQIQGSHRSLEFLKKS